MAAIPYGQRMKDRKLEVDPDQAAVVKYMFEAKQRYTEQSPIWGEAVIDGKYQLWKERQEEVSELTMPEFMKEQGTAAKVRQSLVAYDIEYFSHGIYVEALGFVCYAEECYAGKIDAVKMQKMAL